MGTRPSAADFLAATRYPVTSTATAPGPQSTTAPAVTAAAPPADPVAEAASTTGEPAAVGATGEPRYRTPIDHRSYRTRSPTPVQGASPPETGRLRLIAAGVDLVIILVLIAVLSRLFTVVVDRDVFSFTMHQLLVWVGATVITWLVCTVAWTFLRVTTPGQQIVSAASGTNRPVRVTDR
ncbi:hypothetical protein ACTXKQ_09425 [Corynebacterium variabile]|uniref:RDD family n=2 Tax=Corynebacterium variabile TaxID=1727 RepID=A0A0X2NP37_9CORY|nr:hypothetical protein [Corynebacterium variabile]CUU66609.1 RDD family [Corynebacterium variabile]